MEKGELKYLNRNKFGTFTAYYYQGSGLTKEWKIKHFYSDSFVFYIFEW